MKPRSDISRAVEQFLRQMAANGCAALSIQTYRRELLQLMQALPDVPLSRLTPDRLNGYLASTGVQQKIDGTPKQVATVNRTKSVIRAFFRWCQQTGLINRNPAAHVRLAVTASPSTPHMTRAELARFFRIIRSSPYSLADRDYAMFATLAYTGIRLSDAIRLKTSDVDFLYRQLLLQHTKGGRREHRYLPDRLSRILSRYIQGCRGDPNGQTLFLTRDGQPLSPRAVQYRFAFWLRQARIRKLVSVHSLRHTFGTLLYQTTKDLLLVSRALGHRDVKTTLRYARPGDEILAKAVDRMW